MLNVKRVSIISVYLCIVILCEGITNNTLAQTQWTKYAENPVLSVGPSGAWDSLHIYDSPVIIDNTAPPSERYKMWYGGASGETKFVTVIRVGYATSPDGINWNKYNGNPVMLEGSSGEWDSGYVNPTTVIFDGTTYKMWYTGVEGNDPNCKSAIGYATSPDGITWTKPVGKPVLEVGPSGAWDSSGVGDPTVIFDPNALNVQERYKMWYTAGYDTGHGATARIGYATSPDGKNWTKYDDPATNDPLFAESDPVLYEGPPGAWDGYQIMMPCVLFHSGEYEMWYTGYAYVIDFAIGYATSTDGIHWTKYNNPETNDPPYVNSDPVLKRSPGAWDSTHVYRPRVLIDGNKYKMWYTGGNPQNIGYATSIMPNQPPIINKPPTANAQSITTDENIAIVMTLTGNDPEGKSLTYKIATQPKNGTLTGTAPNLTYKPNTGFSGTDSFTFTVNDSELDSQPATITITVKHVNKAPIANAQSITTDENITIVVMLTGNDPEGKSLTYKITTQPKSGTLTGTAPNLTYKPNTDFSGSDSFTFTANDGELDSQPATITITVKHVNKAPIANAQSITTDENIAIAMALTGNDPEGKSLTFKIANQPRNGTLTGTAPNLTYKPNTGFSGTDSFTFTVNDGELDSLPAVITITVKHVNKAPTANAQSITTDENIAIVITLTGNDPEGKSFTFKIANQPQNGTLTGTAPNVTYKPNTDFSGSDSFTFTVNDGELDSQPATVTITINHINKIPTANAQSITTDENIAITMTLTGNDPEGKSLTYNTTQPKKGTLTGTAPNVTYKPNTDFSGSDSFTFTVNDGELDSQPATITITVNPVVKPSLSIITPTKDQSFPSGTTSAEIKVNISNHNGVWAWKLNDLFPTSGSAGGNLVKTGNTATLTGLKDGQTYTLYVALVDSNSNMLNPSVTAEVKFSIDSQKLAPEFTISTTKDKVTATDGVVTYLLTLQGKNGFSGIITLYDSTLPKNAEATFNPKNVTLSPTEEIITSQLILTVPKDYAPGSYSFTVLAVSNNGMTKNLTLTMNIEITVYSTNLIVTPQPSEAKFKGNVNILGGITVSSEKPIAIGDLTIKLTFTSPTGKTKIFEVKTDAQGSYQLPKAFSPDEMGDWSIKAQFDGNTQLKPSERSMTIKVKKAASEITFDSVITATLGSDITITGHLEPQLKGQNISFKILKPDSAATLTGIPTEEAGVFYHNQKLDISGNWEFTAAWVGNDQYEPVTRILKLPVSEEIGKLIMVLGGGDENSNPNWKAFRTLYENVHNVMLSRGFKDDKDIYALTPDPKATSGTDNVTSVVALEFAITDWAAKQVNSEVPLYIYLMSHNLGENFLLEKRGNQETYLTPSQLNTWLDKLPEGTPVTIIIEACQSGNFIRTSDGDPTPLVKPNRTIITSARGDKQAKVTDCSSFSKIFFGRIEFNYTVADAFAYTEDYMKRSSLHKDQFPQIDSDGDAKVNTPQDYAKVKKQYLPVDMVSLGKPPEIIDITPSQTLAKGVSSLRIYTKLIGTDITRVYATIIPPGYNASKVISDWSELQFPEFDIAKVAGKDNEYAATYSDFTIPGEYTVIINAENPDGSAIPVQTAITVPYGIIKGDVNGDGDVKPNDAILVLRISMGMMEPTSEQRYAADMNGDGKVMANDAILILRKSVGLAAPDFVVTRHAVSNQGIKVTLDVVHGVAGESVTVPLKVNNPDILAGGDVSITYNSSVLCAVDVSTESDVMIASNTSEPGIIRIAFAGLDMACRVPTVAKVKFIVLDDSISPLEIKSMALYRSDAQLIDAKKVDGKFTSWAIAPEKSALLQNFPNPFNPDTWIPYQLKEGNDVIIKIYSTTGEMVRELKLGYKPAGVYMIYDRSAYWDGKNDAGEDVSSGIYFYSIKTNGFTATRKMLVLR